LELRCFLWPAGVAQAQPFGGAGLPTLVAEGRPQLMLGSIACSSPAICGCCNPLANWRAAGGPIAAQRLADLLTGAHA
jgi:hypothetical protein